MVPKIVILIRMQFLNDIIKSEHRFKAAQKFQSFDKNFKFMKFSSSFTAMLLKISTLAFV